MKTTSAVAFINHSTQSLLQSKCLQISPTLLVEPMFLFGFQLLAFFSDIAYSIVSKWRKQNVFKTQIYSHFVSLWFSLYALVFFAMSRQIVSRSEKIQRNLYGPTFHFAVENSFRYIFSPVPTSPHNWGSTVLTKSVCAPIHSYLFLEPYVPLFQILTVPHDKE